MLVQLLEVNTLKQYCWNIQQLVTQLAMYQQELTIHAADVVFAGRARLQGA